MCEGNRVVVWPIGGNKMFELLVPNPVFSVHITADSGAIVTTGMYVLFRRGNVTLTIIEYLYRRVINSVVITVAINTIIF